MPCEPEGDTAGKAEDTPKPPPKRKLPPGPVPTDFVKASTHFQAPGLVKKACGVKLLPGPKIHSQHYLDVCGLRFRGDGPLNLPPPPERQSSPPSTGKREA